MRAVRSSALLCVALSALPAAARRSPFVPSEEEVLRAERGDTDPRHYQERSIEDKRGAVRRALAWVEARWRRLRLTWPQVAFALGLVAALLAASRNSRRLGWRLLLFAGAGAMVAGGLGLYLGWR